MLKKAIKKLATSQCILEKKEMNVMNCLIASTLPVSSNKEFSWYHNHIVVQCMGKYLLLLCGTINITGKTSFPGFSDSV